ncbi:hypothetical protein SMICM304S_02773 [Streptomyces microflavus]
MEAATGWAWLERRLGREPYAVRAAEEVRALLLRPELRPAEGGRRRHDRACRSGRPWWPFRCSGARRCCSCCERTEQGGRPEGAYFRCAGIPAAPSFPRRR